MSENLLHICTIKGSKTCGRDSFWILKLSFTAVSEQMNLFSQTSSEKEFDVCSAVHVYFFHNSLVSSLNDATSKISNLT